MSLLCAVEINISGCGASFLVPCYRSGLLERATGSRARVIAFGDAAAQAGGEVGLRLSPRRRARTGSQYFAPAPDDGVHALRHAYASVLLDAG
jgi:hypothetical protein